LTFKLMHYPNSGQNFNCAVKVIPIPERSDTMGTDTMGTQ
jgi:hypothetical protein